MLTQNEFMKKWNDAGTTAYAAYVKAGDKLDSLSLSEQADAVTGKRTGPSSSVFAAGDVDAAIAKLDADNSKEQLVLAGLAYLIKAGMLAGVGL